MGEKAGPTPWRALFAGGLNPARANQRPAATPAATAWASPAPRAVAPRKHDSAPPVIEVTASDADLAALMLTDDDDCPG